MGYMAAQREVPDFSSLKKGVLYGSVAASFTVEDFSVRSISSVDKEQIENRAREFTKLLQI